MRTSADKEARTPRSRGRSVIVLCHCVRTHQSLNKDTPVSHPVQRIGVISSRGQTPAESLELAAGDFLVSGFEQWYEAHPVG